MDIKDYRIKEAQDAVTNAMNVLIDRICELAADVQKIKNGTYMDLTTVQGAVSIHFHGKKPFENRPHFSIGLKEGWTILPREATPAMLGEIARELKLTLIRS